MKKLAILTLSTLPLAASAQGETVGFFETYFLETVLTLALVVCLIALAVLLVTLSAIKTLLVAQQETEASEEKVKAPSAFAQWWDRINDLKPMEQEAVVLTDHEYDGIRELDNNLPPWWKWMFYVTIIFAVVYLIHYHVLQTGPTSQEEYVAEMAQAEKDVAAYKAMLAANQGESEIPVTGPVAIAAGQKIYMNYCAACHGNKGQGGIGPNFADQYWIHGGSMEDIIATIENGVPAKGMISWKNQLSGPEIQQVSLFIYELEGTNPPNPKDAQGELFERTETEEATGEEEVVGEAVSMN